MVGGRVVSGAAVFGGLSSSASFIITLDDGRRIFAKGNHPDEMSHGTETLRHEVHAYLNLPVLKDTAPAYIGTVSDGDEDGWMLGLWACIDAVNTLPPLLQMNDHMRIWQNEPAASSVLKAARERNYINGFFTCDKKWLRLRDDMAVREKFLSLFADHDIAARWFVANIDRLCALQAAVTKVSCGNGLLHGDLRLDNFLYDGDRLWTVDWPNACYGPLIFDPVFLRMNAEGLGYDGADILIAGYTAIDIAAMTASMTGYFADQAYRAVPPKLPRLRWMQKAMLLAGLSQLARAGMIDSIPVMTGQKPPSS
jgi:hypothetical protein